MNMISKILVSATLIGAFAAQPAIASERIEFTSGGERYVARVSTEGDATRIQGVNASTGQVFRLVVRDGAIKGHYGRTRVSFKEADIIQADTASMNLASR